MHAQLKAEHYKFVEQILEHFLFLNATTINLVEQSKWVAINDCFTTTHSTLSMHVLIWFYEFNLCLTCFDY